MTRKTLLIVVGLMAVVGLTFGFATTGLAYSGISYTGACSGCHTGAATNPVATLVSNNGTTATYNVSSGGTEWALFNGSTRVTGAAGATGQFVVPVPGTYTLFAVLGTVGGGSAQGLGQTAVVVSAPLSQFTITATAGSNGSIDPEGAYSATQGTNVKFTFTPNSGYHVSDVTVDGSSVGGVTSYTFTNVQATHTIAVTFAPGAGSTYTITATAGDHGSINPIGDRQVPAGGSIVYTMQPAEGYQVATITVDGVSLPPTSTAGSPTRTDGWYTFLNVVRTHTIDVTFKLNPPGWFTITPFAGEHGEIWMAQQTVQGTSTIPGALVACSIMPEAGYHVESLVVDGQPVAPATWYIFYNVRSGHTIAATFAVDPLLFNITAAAGAGGHVSQEGVLSVTQGDDVTYTFTADSGYHVADVTVDGTSIGSAASHTFTNVQATHTIVVSFAANAPTQLATSLSFRASTHTIRSGRYVTLYAKLSGGTFTNQSVRFEVKMPGARGYGLIRTVRVTAAGYAHIHLKVGAKGTRYLRARFTGDATHLAAPLRAGWKLVVK
jgi:Divergent InlB B-repeat domain